jgi:DNA-binding MarR family transcriptional regulator
MSDVKSGANLLFLREEELRLAIEMLYFVLRDFSAEPDAILDELGFGRAHHRAIYFIGRNPGITVSDLLTTLRVTKQSLSRVLSQLVSEGFVEQRPGPVDRRQRRLRLTPNGVEVERRLTERQRSRIAAAYRDAGADSVEGFRKVMVSLIDAADRDRFADVGARPGSRGSP